MPGRNADLVREVYRAASERDMERALPLLDEEVELNVSTIAIGQDTYRGHEGIRAYFEEIWDVAETFAFEVEDTVEVDDRVVVSLRVRVVGAGSGVEVAQTYGAVWRIVDGKVTEIRLYPEPAQARRAAES
jgi:ketosteroid isomerase-like protein